MRIGRNQTLGSNEKRKEKKPVVFIMRHCLWCGKDSAKLGKKILVSQTFISTPSRNN